MVSERRGEDRRAVIGISTSSRERQGSCAARRGAGGAVQTPQIGMHPQQRADKTQREPVRSAHAWIEPVRQSEPVLDAAAPTGHQRSPLDQRPRLALGDRRPGQLGVADLQPGQRIVSPCRPALQFGCDVRRVVNK